MTVFKSQLEELMVAEELLFDSTPGFGRYRPYMEQALPHPAKMNVRLLEFLIKSHTKEGDVILDPMAGSGSTGVISALNGRNAVCVELEEKFFSWMEEARKKVEGYSNLSDKGKLVNIKGDARQLSSLVQNADLVLTSPPYGEAQQGQGIAKYGYQGDKHSPTDLVGKRSYMPDKFESKDNISCLSMGDIDAVITSPPYAECDPSQSHMTSKKRADPNDPNYRPSWKRKIEQEGYLDSKRPYAENVDAIITSPPYAETAQDSERSPCVTKPPRKGDVRQSVRKPPINRYSKGSDNIGNLGFVDSVITSPPYSEGTGHERGKSTELQTTKKLYLHGAGSYSKSGENIGEMSGHETYLGAMLKVYNEMWKVLKPKGSAIIVIKPFIRNKKVVDLPWHTWLLLEKVGFQLSKVYKLRLKQDSFWRILYKKKYPDVPQIKHEYILVCQKSPSFYG